jgi:hypothetical protein
MFAVSWLTVAHRHRYVRDVRAVGSCREAPGQTARRRRAAHAGQTGVPRTCAPDAGSATDVPASVRSHRLDPQAFAAPPHCRGGARRLGRESRGSPSASLVRHVGEALAPPAQRLAGGREGLWLGDAPARSGGKCAAPSSVNARGHGSIAVSDTSDLAELGDSHSSPAARHAARSDASPEKFSPFCSSFLDDGMPGE